MHTDIIKMTRHEAATLHREYKKHVAYSQPIDWEIQRAYFLMAKGKVIIRAIESIKQAGLNREFLPKLALTPASAAHCQLERYSDGQISMAPIFPGKRWPQRGGKHNLSFRQNTFVFPRDSFPMAWDGKRRSERSEHQAIVPIAPLHLRPKRGLQNYHVLWEAEWQPIPPRDPYLLRRIGKADLWLVVAHWELTEVERAALATRIAT
jgi:hypothetical protein